MKMIKHFKALENINGTGEALIPFLTPVISKALVEFENDFIQDLSHVSQAARYAGNITLDNIIYLKDNLYRCEYGYDWQIAWTCSGTQETGRIHEKARFLLLGDGQVEFRFLTLESS